MRTRINKDNYKNPNALQPSLIKRAEKVMHTKLQIGDTIEYYRSRYGYILKEELKSINDLDYTYYYNTIDTALSIFDLGLQSMYKKLKKANVKEQLTFDNLLL